MISSNTLTKPGRSQPGQPDTHTHIFQIDSHNIGTCSLCGEVRQFPWEKGSPVIVLKKGDSCISQVKDSQAKISQLKEDDMVINNMEKHRYYEEHKEEILADLRSMGRPATLKKWNIPNGTMSQLEKRWLPPLERHDLTLRSYTERSRAKRKNGGNSLPSFPEFSDDWPKSVQIKWIEVYQQLSKPTA